MSHRKRAAPEEIESARDAKKLNVARPSAEKNLDSELQASTSKDAKAERNGESGKRGREMRSSRSENAKAAGNGDPSPDSNAVGTPAVVETGNASNKPISPKATELEPEAHAIPPSEDSPPGSSDASFDSSSEDESLGDHEPYGTGPVASYDQDDGWMPADEEEAALAQLEGPDDGFDEYFNEHGMQAIWEEKGIASDSDDSEETADQKRDERAHLENKWDL